MLFLEINKLNNKNLQIFQCKRIHLALNNYSMRGSDKIEKKYSKEYVDTCK